MTRLRKERSIERDLLSYWAQCGVYNEFADMSIFFCCSELWSFAYLDTISSAHIALGQFADILEAQYGGMY
jgi:hypothetical protein